MLNLKFFSCFLNYKSSVIMKKRMILPLVAVLFALVGAFASTFTPQVAWFKPPLGEPAQAGAITFPVNVSQENPCTLVGEIQCQINGRDAYDTEQHANAEEPEGLLMYE